MPLLDLPNDLLLIIAEALGPDFRSLNFFLRSNRRLNALLTHTLHKLAIQDTGGVPAILWATLKNWTPLVLLLLEKGVDINLADYEGTTALHYAVNQTHLQLIQLLLSKGADVNARDNTGTTVLHEACYRGSEAMVTLLLDNGADIEAAMNDGTTAFRWAIFWKKEEIVKLLLKRGVNVHARTNDGSTVLHSAVLLRYERIVRLLLENGLAEDVNVVSEPGVYGNSMYCTALHYTATSGGDEVIGRLLLENGADIEARDSLGKTALIWATEFGNVAVVKLLLEWGARKDIVGVDGETAYQRAVARRWLEIENLLADMDES